ncbi:MAG: hypothetical protein ABUT39_21395 [Acidobacteriota bacterium]
MVRAVRNLVVGFALLAPAVHAGQIELLSKAATESDTALGAEFPRYIPPEVSADGRWVAFSSTAVNLVPDQEPNASMNLFLHDRQTGTTALVTHASGSPTVPASGGNVLTEEYSISDDGRWIVYESTARDLVDNQVSDPWIAQVFLYDRETGVNTLLSHSIQGSSISSNDLAGSPRISGDGNWIVYESAATDLLAGQSDTPGTRDVFLQKRANGLRILVSRAAGTPLTAANHSLASASADGRYAVFLSEAPNVIPGQVGGSSQVFLVDRTAGTTTLVSRAAGQTVVAGYGWSSDAAVSADGNYVVFTSIAGNLVPGQIDTNTEDYGGFEIPGTDVFLYDRAASTTALVSHAAGSVVTAGSHASGGVSLSADGRYVTFTSYADDLVPGQIDTGDHTDVFLYDRVAGTTTLVSRKAGTAATAGNNYSVSARISEDGRWIGFLGEATDLVAGAIDTNSYADIFAPPRRRRTSNPGTPG